MSEMDLSSAAKALLRAAKSDGPSAAARAKIWSGVASSGAVGAAGAGGAAAGAAGEGSVAGAGAGATGAALGGGKLMIVGALFGSAVTVGLAATLLSLRPIPQLRPDPQQAPIAMQAPAYGGAAGGNAVAGRRDADRALAAAGTAANGAHPGAHTPVAGRVLRVADESAVRAAQEDTLMRESALVAEARGALIRGDAEAALASLRVTHAMKERALEPEELSIEARALRALGREGEAVVVESLLKSRYPEHALAR